MSISPLGKQTTFNRSDRSPAHSVNVADGIGRSNLPETVRIIHNWRNKINRLNDGGIG